MFIFLVKSEASGILVAMENVHILSAARQENSDSSRNVNFSSVEVLIEEVLYLWCK